MSFINFLMLVVTKEGMAYGGMTGNCKSTVDRWLRGFLVDMPLKCTVLFLM